MALVEIKVSDITFMRNRDWDPLYFRELYSEDFYEFSQLCQSGVRDSKLVAEMEKFEPYCPVTEDISMDDQELCSAVEQIEHERV